MLFYLSPYTFFWSAALMLHVKANTELEHVAIVTSTIFIISI